MDEIKGPKDGILNKIAEVIAHFSREEQIAKQKTIENKLFEFANFIEAVTVFSYTGKAGEIPAENVIRRALELEKAVVLPVYPGPKNSVNLYRINEFSSDLVENDAGVLEPIPRKCKRTKPEEIDVALIPGLVFDDKGGRIGFGDGFYKKLITQLPETCRKISLAFEEQVVDQVNMDSRKHSVDIIITDKRVIYKI
ncbi:MAG: 5-formyltetrahydrofolate cyclo-ligase [Desulfarculaceae bacterium]|nr:5-formyltetrahydrofolate cyclo-ligase [Desulfarculaceae bacterium]